MTRRVATGSFLLVLFGLIVAAIVGASSGSGDSSTSTLKHADRTFHSERLQDGDTRVAIVPIEGVIVNGDNAPGGSATGGDDTVALLEEIRTSGKFDGIILEVNSPGGAVLASAEIADEIERARKAKIKVVSWMRDSAASGGYYVSANADKIVAAPTTITGSIGVILEYVTAEKLADKIGIKPVIVKSGKLKDMGSPFRDLTHEEAVVLQTMINEAYGDFVSVVAEGRDIDEDKVREIADGRIYTGRQAVDNGLVDELGTRDKAYDVMGDLLDTDGEDLEVLRFSRQFGFSETFFSGSARDLGAGEAARMAGDLLGAVFSGEKVSLSPGGSAGGDARSAFVSLEYRAVL